jgi:tRNA (guanine37-N1)-methyltransferase
MKIRLLTLFPDMMNEIFSHSILKRAQDRNLIEIECINIRDFADNKHKSVDDYPYGGGPGMVMTPQPIFDAHRHVKEALGKAGARTIYCTPKGVTFTQQKALELACEESLIFICGHYEGIDQRVIDHLATDELSIGDYVLTGGELPAAVMIDAIARMIPGVLKENISFQEESFFSDLLEYPQYTRPPEYQGYQVPDVLLSGHHEKIRQWRRYESFRETFYKRPDLIRRKELNKEEREWLESLQKVQTQD